MAAVELALVLLLALGVPCQAADINGDGTRGPESSAFDSLKRLEQRLQHLEDRLEQQNLKINRQEQLLQEQTMKNNHQEVVLQKQTRKISQQAQVIQQLLHDSRQKTSHMQALDPKSSEAKSRVSDASAEHNRSSRSDDLDPLQATVLRLDQTVTQLTAQTQALSSKSDVMAQDIHTASASAFVRWGHAQCPDHSDLVYSGVVGGSFYAHKGAATNYLCLTMKPTLRRNDLPAYHAYLYGAEYQTGDSHNDKDPVCAVCRARTSATVMIPGTDTCTAGWVKQYSGQLMTGGSGDSAGSEYVCVDASMQSRPGSSDNHNGKSLFYVTAVCGSLPCEPYVNGTVVGCVVCSQ